MIFVYNTIHAHLRTGWFPAERLYSDIRSVGVLRFLYMYLEGVKLLCEDMMRREGAGIWIAAAPPAANLSPSRMCFYGRF
jgi:hypothetical protein